MAISWKAAPTEDEMLAKAKEAKLAEINAAAESAIQSIRSKYPQFEIDSWQSQEAEAREWVADNSASTPILSAIAEARGISLSDLVSRVIAKADAYRPAVAGVIGIRQDLEDKIERYTTVHTVNSISWPSE